ncbi:MAG: hypothetical protein Q4C47_07315, partial [Planctomycetia bacterium]|nr:hypothetical protein [Planctomycetia bacterium]
MAQNETTDMGTPTGGTPLPASGNRRPPPLTGAVPVGGASSELPGTVDRFGVGTVTPPPLSGTSSSGTPPMVGTPGAGPSVSALQSSSSVSPSSGAS